MAYFYQKLEVIMQKENEEIVSSVAIKTSEEEITEQEYNDLVEKLTEQEEQC